MTCCGHLKVAINRKIKDQKIRKKGQRKKGADAKTNDSSGALTGSEPTESASEKSAHANGSCNAFISAFRRHSGRSGRKSGRQKSASKVLLGGQPVSNHESSKKKISINLPSAGEKLADDEKISECNDEASHLIKSSGDRLVSNRESSKKEISNNLPGAGGKLADEKEISERNHEGAEITNQSKNLTDLPERQSARRPRASRGCCGFFAGLNHKLDKIKPKDELPKKKGSGGKTSRQIKASARISESLDPLVAHLPSIADDETDPSFKGSDGKTTRLIKASARISEPSEEKTDPLVTHLESIADETKQQPDKGSDGNDTKLIEASARISEPSEEKTDPLAAHLESIADENKQQPAKGSDGKITKRIEASARISERSKEETDPLVAHLVSIADEIKQPAEDSDGEITKLIEASARISEPLERKTDPQFSTQVDQVASIADETKQPSKGSDGETTELIEASARICEPLNRKTDPQFGPQVAQVAAIAEETEHPAHLAADSHDEGPSSTEQVAHPHIQASSTTCDSKPRAIDLKTCDSKSRAVDLKTTRSALSFSKNASIPGVRIEEPSGENRPSDFRIILLPSARNASPSLVAASEEARKDWMCKNQSESPIELTSPTHDAFTIFGNAALYPTASSFGNAVERPSLAASSPAEENCSFIEGDRSANCVPDGSTAVEAQVVGYSGLSRARETVSCGDHLTSQEAFKPIASSLLEDSSKLRASQRSIASWPGNAAPLNPLKSSSAFRESAENRFESAYPASGSALVRSSSELLGSADERSDRQFSSNIATSWFRSDQESEEEDEEAYADLAARVAALVDDTDEVQDRRPHRAIYSALIPPESLDEDENDSSGYSSRVSFIAPETLRQGQVDSQTLIAPHRVQIGDNAQYAPFSHGCAPAGPSAAVDEQNQAYLAAHGTQPIALPNEAEPLVPHHGEFALEATGNRDEKNYASFADHSASATFHHDAEHHSGLVDEVGPNYASEHAISEATRLTGVAHHANAGIAADQHLVATSQERAPVAPQIDGGQYPSLEASHHAAFPEESHPAVFHEELPRILDPQDELVQMHLSAAQRFYVGERQINPRFDSQYHLADYLGEGAFGFVMAAEKIVDVPLQVVSRSPNEIARGARGPAAVTRCLPDKVAVKFLKRSRIPMRTWVCDPNHFACDVTAEIAILAECDHPNIIKVLDVFLLDDFLIAMMELHGTSWDGSNPLLNPVQNPAFARFASSPALGRAAFADGPQLGHAVSHPILMPNGATALMRRRTSTDLFECIDSHSGIGEDICRRIIYQVIHALAYLHSKGIVHGDIKDENIVIDEQYKIKLIDFGSASHRTVTASFNGTVNFGAPEALSGGSYVGSKQDIWSTGVLFFTIATGENPFKGKENVLAGHYSRAFPSTYSNVGQRLLRRLLWRDPEKRPEAFRVLFDPWFQRMVGPNFPGAPAYLT